MTHLVGITIARIYCTHETREAYEMVWSGLWDTIARVTGQPMRFHFLHGQGLRGIVVDGCKAQVQGCGDDLVKRSLLSDSLITDKNPESIVQHFVKVCEVHWDRYEDRIS